MSEKKIQKANPNGRQGSQSGKKTSDNVNKAKQQPKSK